MVSVRNRTFCTRGGGPVRSRPQETHQKDPDQGVPDGATKPSMPRPPTGAAFTLNQ